MLICSETQLQGVFYAVNSKRLSGLVPISALADYHNRILFFFFLPKVPFTCEWCRIFFFFLMELSCPVQHSVVRLKINYSHFLLQFLIFFFLSLRRIRLQCETRLTFYSCRPDESRKGYSKDSSLAFFFFSLCLRESV